MFEEVLVWPLRDGPCETEKILALDRRTFNWAVRSSRSDCELQQTELKMITWRMGSQQIKPWVIFGPFISMGRCYTSKLLSMLSPGRIVFFIPVGQAASPKPSEPILSDGLHTSVKFADICCGVISIRVNPQTCPILAIKS